MNRGHEEKTRPDTRLTQPHAGGQGPCLRSLRHLGRSSEAKDRKEIKRIKSDQPANRWTDKAGCRDA